MAIIQDPFTSKAVLVTEQGQLTTRATTITDIAEASDNGNCYSCPTDFLAITTPDVWYGVWYLKNTNTHPYHIDFIRASSKAGVTQWKIIKNPTTGTLISGGTLFIPKNTNFSSALQSGLEFRIGGEGFTLTNGDLLGQMQAMYSERFDVNGTIIIPAGSTIAVMAKCSVATDIGSTLQIYKDS